MTSNHPNKAPALMRKAAWSDWFMRRIHYITAELQQYHLTSTGLAANNANVPKARCLILSRRCYQEKSETFPIASAAELKKILRQRDDTSLHYHYIGPLQNGQRQVTTITVNDQVRSHCQSALWVFPVSLLIAAADEKCMYDINTPDNRFFQLVRGKGQWQSVPASPLIADSGKALLMMGGAAQTPVKVVRNEQLTALLSQAWRRLPLTAWTTAWSLRPTEKVKWRWQPLAWSALLLGCLYLVASSVYLNQQLTQRQQKLASYGGQLDAVLASRQRLEQTEQLITTLAERANQPEQSIALWSTIAALQMQDVRLTVLQTDMQQLTLQGEAGSATDVLQNLLQLDFVGSASFSAPVRRAQGGRELFTIVMTLNSTVFKKVISDSSSDVEQVE